MAWKGLDASQGINALAGVLQQGYRDQRQLEEEARNRSRQDLMMGAQLQEAAGKGYMANNPQALQQYGVSNVPYAPMGVPRETQQQNLAQLAQQFPGHVDPATGSVSPYLAAQLQKQDEFKQRQAAEQAALKARYAEMAAIEGLKQQGREGLVEKRGEVSRKAYQVSGGKDPAVDAKYASLVKERSDLLGNMLALTDPDATSRLKDINTEVRALEQKFLNSAPAAPSSSSPPAASPSAGAQIVRSKKDGKLYLRYADGRLEPYAGTVGSDGKQ